MVIIIIITIDDYECDFDDDSDDHNDDHNNDMLI